MPKLLKSDYIYLCIVIILLFLVVFAVFPKMKGTIETTKINNQATDYLELIKNKESELNDVANGNLSDYFSLINYNIEDSLINIESKNLAIIIGKTYSNIKDDTSKIKDKLGTKEYEEAYNNIFWPEFYNVYETEPIVKSQVSPEIENGEISLTNGKNIRFISALLGMSYKEYQTFLTELRESEDRAIEAGLMTEADRTPGIYI